MLSNSSKAELGNMAFNWAYNTLSALLPYTCGTAVISPGSRSTPLTMASTVLTGLSTQVILDERSAAFAALGMAKQSGKPALLICTSGTAAANYYPAVIEACQSAVPMIVLSADRPPRLQNSGANQTIDQHELFGKYALFYDAGLPDSTTKRISALKKTLEKLGHESLQSRVPLQVNVPFDKPLEPTRGQYQRFAKKTMAEPPPEASILPDEVADLPETFIQRLRASKQPVIVVGQHQPFDPLLLSTVEIAGKLNAPILAGTTSQWFGATVPQRFIHGFNAFLRSQKIRNQLQPDLIIRIGDAVVGKGIINYLEHHHGVFQAHFSTTGKPADFTNSLDITIPVNSYRFEWPEGLEKAEKGWFEQWQLLSEWFKKKRDDSVDSISEFTDLHAMVEILKTLRREQHLFVGNSLAIRDLELVADSGKLHQAIYANRGASGIDGNISTAAGIALQLEAPVVSITGDLTFLHDTNGLMVAQNVQQLFLMVVINNGGGTIFDMLPVARHRSIMERYFRTPQEVEIEYLAKSYQIPYFQAEKSADLQSVMKEIHEINGPVILECITDAEQSMNLRKQIWNYPWHENLHI